MKSSSSVSSASREPRASLAASSARVIISRNNSSDRVRIFVWDAGAFEAAFPDCKGGMVFVIEVSSWAGSRRLMGGSPEPEEALAALELAVAALEWAVAAVEWAVAALEGGLAARTCTLTSPATPSMRRLVGGGIGEAVVEFDPGGAVAAAEPGVVG